MIASTAKNAGRVSYEASDVWHWERFPCMVSWSWGVLLTRIGLLVVVAIVLALVGSAVSFTAYSQSGRTVTMTSTTTSTRTITSERTESFLLTTVSAESWSRVIELSSAEYPFYCGIYDYVALDLAPGAVHVSWTSTGAVLFWMYTEEHFRTYESNPRCSYSDVGAIIYRSANQAKFDTQIAVGGSYYFLFLNMGGSPVTIRLNVEESPHQSVITLTTHSTVYSTEKTIYPTQVVTTTPRQTLAYFFGMALVMVGIVLVILEPKITQRGRPVGVLPTQPIVTVATERKEMVSTKYCRYCGAKIPRESEYCEECGRKIV